MPNDVDRYTPVDFSLALCGCAYVAVERLISFREFSACGSCTPLHPAALASVPYGIVLVRVRGSCVTLVSCPGSDSTTKVPLRSTGTQSAHGLWLVLRLFKESS